MVTGNRIKHTDGVTSIYKQAAQAVGVEDPKGVGDLIRMSRLGSLNAVADLFQVAAAAVWAAYYACPVCGGKGSKWWCGKDQRWVDCPVTDRCPRPSEIPCPLGHVEMVNPFGGSVVYADPNMAEWRCRGPQPECAADVSYSYQPYRFHAGCGWVPLPMEADDDR